jgi:C4-type Zn-finger protein
MAQIRNAICPTCGADVSVTYWPYNVPLYTMHIVRGSNRDCRNSLRPVEVEREEKKPPAP